MANDRLKKGNHCMKFLDYDVLVAGGGTAGTAAAVAAARRGHRVLLIEEQNCLGGVSTGGGIGEWFASLEGMGNIFATCVSELDNFGGRYEQKRLFNPEYLKFIWQRLAEHAGVDILFHASVCGVAKKGQNIRNVDVFCCSQKLTAQAKYFIDTTGEGDLGALAGAEFTQGNPDNGLVLHMTLGAWMYDTGKTQKPYLPEELNPISGEDELPGLAGGWLIDKGRIFMNATKVVRRDPTDPFSLSHAELEARNQLTKVAHYLQTHGFPTFALAGSGSKIGIREGRRLTGDFTLTQNAILNRSEPLRFDDGVAVATSQIDFHSLTKLGNSGWRQKVMPYSIPRRCLVAKGFQNLLMAGKCISTDQVVHSSCRMTPTCCAMGQAVGTMAALAVELGLANIREVPLVSLQETLAADGMELDPEKHVAFVVGETRLDDDDIALPIGARDSTSSASQNGLR
jgi:hypothetical protein